MTSAVLPGLTASALLQTPASPQGASLTNGVAKAGGNSFIGVLAAMLAGLPLTTAAVTEAAASDPKTIGSGRPKQDKGKQQDPSKNVGNKDPEPDHVAADTLAAALTVLPAPLPLWHSDTDGAPADHVNAAECVNSQQNDVAGGPLSQGEADNATSGKPPESIQAKQASAAVGVPIPPGFVVESAASPWPAPLEPEPALSDERGAADAATSAGNQSGMESAAPSQAAPAQATASAQTRPSGAQLAFAARLTPMPVSVPLHLEMVRESRTPPGAAESNTPGAAQSAAAVVGASASQVRDARVAAGLPAVQTPHIESQTLRTSPDFRPEAAGTPDPNSTVRAVLPTAPNILRSEAGQVPIAAAGVRPLSFAGSSPSRAGVTPAPAIQAAPGSESGQDVPADQNPAGSDERAGGGQAKTAGPPSSEEDEKLRGMEDGGTRPGTPTQPAFDRSLFAVPVFGRDDSASQTGQARGTSERAPALPAVAEAETPAPISQTQPQVLREVSLLVPGRVAADGTPGPQVEVRIMERTGEVQVAVHSADLQLNSSLRQDLPQLVAQLGDRGFHAETSQPAGAAVGGEIRTVRAENGSADSGRDSGLFGNSGRGGSGSGQRHPDQGQRDQKRNHVEWDDALDFSLGRASAPGRSSL